MSYIDLDYLQRHGSLCANDANLFHKILCEKKGVTDPDEVVRIWNNSSPELAWGEKGHSDYIDHLTEIVITFMDSKSGKEGA